MKNYWKKVNVTYYTGTSKLDWAVALTAVKRAPRETVNDEIEVMFDCASPYCDSKRTNVYTTCLKNDSFGYVMDSAIDDKRLAGTDISLPGIVLGDRLTMGDVCWYKPGMLNKIGKEGKTSWDSLSHFPTNGTQCIPH